MSVEPSSLLPRPKRADARRNYDKLLVAARDAFADDGADASLEDIARRAEVGIGTLYRHFPTRPDLLEAVYLGEMESICRAAEQLAAELPPWEALAAWLRLFLDYAATKRAIANDLQRFIDKDAEVFQVTRGALFAAGEPLVERAQAAGVVRTDATFFDLVRLVGGIAGIHGADPGQIDRIFAMALDGIKPPR